VVLVVGLGNPGPAHAGDRHNVGFMVVDALRGALGLPEYKSKFGGLFTVGQPPQARVKVMLLEPQAFMNRSGESVRAAVTFYRVLPEDLVVVHDELDLPWSQVRLKLGGGHAGHNGVRSVIESLGTPEFVRVRVGIGKAPPWFVGGGADWVLSPFTSAERAELPATIDAAAQAVLRVIEDGTARAMAIVNAKRRER
jgi:peptidyl-tRNA hydrolase, PTH1 family